MNITQYRLQPKLDVYMGSLQRPRHSTGQLCFWYISRKSKCHFCEASCLLPYTEHGTMHCSCHILTLICDHLAFDNHNTPAHLHASKRLGCEMNHWPGRMRGNGVQTTTVGIRLPVHIHHIQLDLVTARVHVATYDTNGFGRRCQHH